MVAAIMDETVHPVDGSRVLRVRWEVKPFDDKYLWTLDAAHHEISSCSRTTTKPYYLIPFMQISWQDPPAAKAEKVNSGGKKRKHPMVDEFDALTSKEQCDRKDDAYKRHQIIEDRARTYHTTNGQQIPPSSFMLSIIAWYLTIEIQTLSSM